MKALSIRQPWATLIISGGPVFKAIDNPDGTQRLDLAGLVFKDIENRNWPTDVRERVCIHAPNKRDDFIETIRWLGQHIGLSIYACTLLQSPRLAPTGVLIGEVDIVDCVKESKSHWFVGPYGFVLANPKAYAKPIPYKGRLGFFNIDR